MPSNNLLIRQATNNIISFCCKSPNFVRASILSCLNKTNGIHPSFGFNQTKKWNSLAVVNNWLIDAASFPLNGDYQACKKNGAPHHFQSDFMWHADQIEGLFGWRKWNVGMLSQYFIQAYIFVSSFFAYLYGDCTVGRPKPDQESANFYSFYCLIINQSVG